MSWCIGLGGPQDPELAAQFFSALGRALFVATEFERKCAFVLQTGTSAKRIQDDPGGKLTFEDIFAPAMKGRASLASTVKVISPLVTIHAADLALLDAGRVARNGIVHSIGAVGSTVGLSSTTVRAALRDLGERMQALARADGVISGWTFCIEHQESPPPWLKDAYPIRLLEWVLTGRSEGLHEDRAAYDVELRARLLAGSHSPADRAEIHGEK